MSCFCESCLEYVNIREEDVEKSKIIKGEVIVYRGKEAYCEECNNIVHSAETRDYNLAELDRAFNKGYTAT